MGWYLVYCISLIPGTMQMPIRGGRERGKEGRKDHFPPLLCLDPWVETLDCKGGKKCNEGNWVAKHMTPTLIIHRGGRHDVKNIRVEVKRLELKCQLSYLIEQELEHITSPGLHFHFNVKWIISSQSPFIMKTLMIMIK